MVATEVGPKKDELKAVKKAAEEAAAQAKADLEAKEAELKTAQELAKTLETEVTPFRTQARTAAIKKALIEKRKDGENEVNPLINADKFEDVLLLAKVTDTDTPEDVVKKVSEFISTRTEFAYAEAGEPDVTPVVTPTTPAAAGITVQSAKPAEPTPATPQRMVTRG